MRTNLKMRGSIHHRPNGKRTVVAAPEFDPKKGRMARRSLGTFATEKEAHDRLLEYNLLDDTDLVVERTTTGTSVRTYLVNWVRDTVNKQESTGEIARSTANDYRQVVENHLILDLGHLRIADLDPARLRSWLRGLRVSRGPRRRALSDRTVLKLYRVLHRAFADADLPVNPIRLPSKDRPKVRSERTIIRPTVAEVTGFLAHIGSCDSPWGRPLASFWRLMASTGLRRSEACGLSWDDLEIDNGSPTLTVVRGLHEDDKGWYIGAPKSKESRRTIGISESLVRELREMRNSRAEAKAVEVDGAEESLDLVFRFGVAHEPPHPDAATRWFKREWHHAGLRSGVTLHGLRHSHGSALLAKGRPFTEVAARMGHTPQVLLSRYARDLDEAGRLDRMRAVTEDLYG